jgi:hypothetical protein
MAETYDWTKSCTGTREDKDLFHKVSRNRLKALAKDLGLAAGSFEIRSNMGGNAVSGEISLQHNDFRIEASSPGTRQERGLRMHTCKNRENDAKFNGNNHFAPLTWLDDKDRPKLKKLVEQVIEQKLGFNADVKTDPGYNPHLSTLRFSK